MAWEPPYRRASAGELLVRALVSRDQAGLGRLLAEGISFKALTPRRFWEAESPDEVASIFFDAWFEPSDVIERVLAFEEGDPAPGLYRVAYRFAIRNEKGAWVVEQQAYYEVENEQITFLRVLCSGSRRSE